MTQQREPTRPREHNRVTPVKRKRAANPGELRLSDHAMTVAKQHLYDTERSIDPDLLHEERQRLLLARRELGIVAADAQWVNHLCTNWFTALRGENEMTERSMMQLAVGMSLSLPMRDALIISMVACEDAGGVPVTKQLMVAFATQPHEPQHVAAMSDMLSCAFEHRYERVDVNRCRRGMHILSTLVRGMPEEYTVQPLAVLAYIAWWMGDERACEYALRALRLDESCTLAGIVCAALGQGL